ncbi:hypothetical protein BH24ACT4_BH24ACT4_03020 [soil metagenome]
MSIGFRHGDTRHPFLWESSDQPPARWHGPGEGPVHYLADTPDGAWAELLRHEEITDPADLAGIRRRLWAIEVPDQVVNSEPVDLSATGATGGLGTYPRCQAYARLRRAAGTAALRAPSAALSQGGARGQRVDGGQVEATDREGAVWVLFGRWPEGRGWAAVDAGRPTPRVLSLVRPLTT